MRGNSRRTGRQAGGVCVQGRPTSAFFPSLAIILSGHSMIGPISRASEALLAAKRADFDAAVLDINLGDGMAYPVTEVLAARGVPFVFITGYEAETTDDRFSEVPVLQKPIERQMLQRLFTPTVNVAAVVHRDGRGAAKAQVRT